MLRKYWVWHFRESFSADLEMFLNSQYENGWKLFKALTNSDNTFTLIFKRRKQK